jgi:AraC family transcriptional activator of tynA and feaB
VIDDEAGRCDAYGHLGPAGHGEQGMTAHWSTAQVHPRDRVAYWVDQVCDACHVDCEPRRDTALFGDCSVAGLAGTLQFGKGASTAQALSRSPRQIARGNSDFFHICVMSYGRALLRQDGREALLEPGDFVLSDRTRPYQFIFDGEFSQTVVMMPRQVLIPRVGSAERFTAIRIDGSKGLGGLLSPLLQNLGGPLRDMPADAQARIAENIIDLVATAVLSECEGLPISSGMTCVRVKFWIETHLAQDLSGERIASECGVSVRHLNRLFARDGVSLMQYVWERRLARCQRELTDPMMGHRSISEIAIASGFKELSHFSRAYRARYGQTARDDRAAQIRAKHRRNETPD